MSIPASPSFPRPLPEVAVPADACVRRGDRLPGRIRYSVVIACYQSAGYVCHAVDSVLSQGRPDVEVIVVDDGSSDAPDRALGERLDSIVYCRQSNRGLSGARNTGLALSRGRYFVSLDADDHLESGFFEALDACVETHRSPDAIATDTRFVGDHPLSGRLESEAKGYRGSSPTRLDVLEMKVPSVGHAVMRRDVFIAAGGYDVQTKWVEDWDMVLRMLARGARFVACMDAVYGYLQHGSTRVTGRGARNASWGTKVFGRALEWPVWSPQERDVIERHAKEARILHAYHSLGDAIEQADYGTIRPLLKEEAAIGLHDRLERFLLRTIRLLPDLVARLAFTPAARLLTGIRRLRS